MAICDWGQAEIVEEQVYKQSNIMPWTKHFRPQCITVQCPSGS